VLTLDFRTLLVVAAANLFIVSAVLPLVMGRHVSRAARHAQASLLVQAVGWAAIVASGYVAEAGFATVSMACAMGSQWLVFQALQGWLGPRRGGRLLLALVVVMPAVYAANFDHYAFRVGWTNALLAFAMLVVARACLRPSLRVGRGWRWVLCGAQVAGAAFLLWRGALGAFDIESFPGYRAPHPVNLAAGLVANMTLVLSVVTLLVAWRDEAEAALRDQAITDPLTGVLNRRGWTDRAEAQFASAVRHDHPLSLLLLDLDHFKHVNDTHGHAKGDQALRLFARKLSKSQRSGDLVGRWGGEEFAVLLFHGAEDAGAAFDRRLRKWLREVSPKELGFPLDFSAGLATRGPGDQTLEAMLRRADEALYAAKGQGRGRLVG
jgi:diguanylate cyclase (GGDEF)-like protein